MPNQDLIDYINSARAAQMPDEEIKSALLAQGWQIQDINEASGSITTASPAPTAKSHSKNKWLVPGIVIGALLVGGLVFGGWQLLKDKGSNDQNSQTQQQNQDQNNQTQSEPDNSFYTAVKSTYINDKHGYELMYPSKASVVGISDAGNEVAADQNTDRVMVKMEGEYVLTIKVLSGELSNQLIKNEAVEDFIKSSSKVGTQDATKATTSNTDKAWLFVAKNGKIYVFTSNNSLEGSVRAAIETGIKNILQSVKFAQVIDTSAWSTYQASGSKLSFKYPGGYEVADELKSAGIEKDPVGRVITVKRADSDITAQFVIGINFCTFNSQSVFCSSQLDLNKSDSEIMQQISYAFVGNGQSPFWNFKRASVNSAKGLRMFLVQGQNNATVPDSYFFPFPGVSVGKKTSANLMIVGPSLFSGSGWNSLREDSAKKFITESQDWINNKKYNSNVAENYKIFEAIVSTITLN